MIDRAQALKAIENAASLLRLHPEVKEEMKISDFCGDSLEYLELMFLIEADLDLDTEIPDANAPPIDSTVGQVAEWIVEVCNG